MLPVLVALAVLAIVALPQFWVRHTFTRHGVDRPDLPGTGGEFARHLLDRFGLNNVAVETSDRGDHYDPANRTVRLLPQHHCGRSLSAVAIAAHEVSHAIQHARGEKSLAIWWRLTNFAASMDRLAGFFFIAAPILAIVFRSPIALLALGLIGVGLLLIRVLVSLVTLPVEFDASFSKALPIVEEGRYLAEDDMPAIRSVLRAAAFTYLAGALIALVNLARWVRVLR